MGNEQVGIGVLGANGRMGKAIIGCIEQESGCFLSAAVVRKGSELVSQQVSSYPQAVRFVENIAGSKTAVLIDFTHAENTLSNLAYCVQQQVAMVIGTTGLNKEQELKIKEAAQHIPIVYASNMSIGVNATYALLKLASKLLGAHSDIELIEAHHRHKKDAPSGTALSMARTIAQSMGWDENDAINLQRTQEQHERRENQIGISVVRAGEIVGEHTVMFAGKSETVEISHKAQSRSVFAEGAVVAAKFIVNQKPGLYDMSDVLGL